MSRSLSVLLPVHNVQSSLSERVNEVLDVVAELTDRFELLILDDGSTDATWEIARELARRYPQVRLQRESVRRGPSLALRRALREARGDAIIAHDGRRAVNPWEIVRLWRVLDARAAAPGSIRSAGSGGFQLLRPGAIEDLRRSVAAVQEVARSDAPRRTATESSSFELATAIDHGTRNMPRPNFLSRIKSRVREFTLGE